MASDSAPAAGWRPPAEGPTAKTDVEALLQNELHLARGERDAAYRHGYDDGVDNTLRSGSAAHSNAVILPDTFKDNLVAFLIGARPSIEERRYEELATVLDEHIREVWPAHLAEPASPLRQGEEEPEPEAEVRHAEPGTGWLPLADGQGQDAVEAAKVALAEKFVSSVGWKNPDWDIDKPDGETNQYYLTVPMAERTEREPWVHFTDTDGHASFRAASIPEIVEVLAGAGLLATTPPTQPGPLQMAREYGVKQREALEGRAQETACDRRTAPTSETATQPSEEDS